MKAENIVTTIAVEILNRTAKSLEIIFSDLSKLKNSVKYNKTELNTSLEKDFSCMIEILQTVVDKYYQNYYEVNKFVPFSLDNFNYALEVNSSTLKSFNKLLNFVK